MKKIYICLLMLFFIVPMFCGCATKQQKPNMVQSKRRFEKYIQPQTNPKNNTVIDLSEGPRQNYNGYLGPKELNFDIKIVDPY